LQSQSRSRRLEQNTQVDSRIFGLDKHDLRAIIAVTVLKSALALALITVVGHVFGVKADNFHCGILD
jgi:hypothetical protein